MFVRHADSFPRDEVKAGTKTTRQVLVGPDEGPNFAMRRFIMEPGGGMPRHTNTVEHEQYVLRGRARIGIGGEVHEVRAAVELVIGGGLDAPAFRPFFTERGAGGERQGGQCGQA